MAALDLQALKARALDEEPDSLRTRLAATEAERDWLLSTLAVPLGVPKQPEFIVVPKPAKPWRK